MTISRRRFLAGIGIGAALGAAPVAGIKLLGPVLGFGGPSRSLDLATVTADTFRPHVGSSFRLRQPGGRSLDLELTEVASAPADGGRTESFSLRFLAAEPLDAPQAVHPLEHAVLGHFGLFLVPVAGSATAVVNHLVTR